MSLLEAPFQTVVSRLQGAVVVAIHGELDIYTAPGLRGLLHDIIEDQGNLTVVVDLARMTFIDSSGLSALVGALKSIRSRGGELTLANPTRGTLRAFEISGLNRIFTVTGE